MCELSVVLPTYNERENIVPLISAIFAACPVSTEIVVVDDDSPDRTWEVVETLARRDRRVRLLRRVGRSGLTSALSDGIDVARGSVVAWLDSDLSQPPEKIPELLARIREGADIAVGSRYVPGGRDARVERLPVVMSLIINRFAQSMLGHAITDYTTGFVCARREVVRRLGLRGDYGEYCIDLLCRARRAGYRVVEVPYVFISRTHGESKTASDLRGFLWRGRKYVATILRLWAKV